MSEGRRPSVSLRQIKDYQFSIDFGAGIPPLLADESAPLGSGAGPSPVQLLLAAVANCMSDSLYFAMRKFHQDPKGIQTNATASVGRNEKGRLRVQEITVNIGFEAKAEEIEHLDRILNQFEDFCTVGQSVRAGIATTVIVSDGTGKELHKTSGKA
ncbi:MAG: OsmC family protein [Acidobacteriia bacterium]|nr:OsmC family protein [Methyloceanibacter sp.]MBX5472613.1 OsmC family protein [Acetobacteraceae bacterium]MCL6491156.1 OsmC family protein [Terriglobia bacterium]